MSPTATDRSPEAVGPPEPVPGDGGVDGAGARDPVADDTHATSTPATTAPAPAPVPMRSGRSQGNTNSPSHTNNPNTTSDPTPASNHRIRALT
ncbi:hypothetical protein [Streptomyces sp. ME19-01-6]|uniref:hypothetical protein n=1 Tax=Streptomyces sp. ME19-01-6 TaxID=3028686 RepID=UPI0029A4A031|nr:hypothetical protein [Streptomyces sp. ME19-01-6]MDX3231088.1 hypothetical protein [Streptomyces sp. ME19-01-6]